MNDNAVFQTKERRNAESVSLRRYSVTLVNSLDLIFLYRWKALRQLLTFCFPLLCILVIHVLFFLAGIGVWWYKMPSSSTLIFYLFVEKEQLLVIHFCVEK